MYEGFSGVSDKCVGDQCGVSVMWAVVRTRPIILVIFLQSHHISLIPPFRELSSLLKPHTSSHRASLSSPLLDCTNINTLHFSNLIKDKMITKVMDATGH